MCFFSMIHFINLLVFSIESHFSEYEKSIDVFNLSLQDRNLFYYNIIRWNFVTLLHIITMSYHLNRYANFNGPYTNDFLEFIFTDYAPSWLVRLWFYRSHQEIQKIVSVLISVFPFLNVGFQWNYFRIQFLIYGND